jgi:glycosyltransferase involved in cell wall biosynthesis
MILIGRPKIAFLVSDTDGGGTATSTSLLVKNIDRDKFRVVVVACGPGPKAAKIGAVADEYHNLNIGSYPPLRKIINGKEQEDLLARVHLIVWLIRCVWRLTKWLKKEKIDLIHTNSVEFNLIAGIAGRLTGVPSVWHIRSPQKMAWRRGGPFLVEGYLAAWLATKVIANSYFTAKACHKSWERKIVVVWNAINVEDIIAHQCSGRLREIANVAADKKIVGLSGHIEHRKGIDRFIAMAAQLAQKRDDVRFVVIGGDVAQKNISQAVKAELLRQAEDLGIIDKLCFAGHLDNAPYYLGDMDAFFMCSLPGTETFGLVVIEAMAAGVPVVAFNNDAMGEIIIDGETGYLVPEGEVDLAAERISSILDDKVLANDLKKAGLNRVRTYFEISRLINSTQELYYEILLTKNRNASISSTFKTERVNKPCE